MRFIEYVMIVVVAIMTVMFAGSALYSALFLDNLIACVIALMCLMCFGLLLMYKQETDAEELEYNAQREKTYWDYHKVATKENTDISS